MHWGVSRAFIIIGFLRLSLDETLTARISMVNLTMKV